MKFLRSMLRSPSSLLLLLIVSLSAIPARASEWEELQPLWGDSVDLAAGGRPAIVYAAAHSRLFESIDGGRSWQLVTSGADGLSTLLGRGGVFKVDPLDSRLLYVTDPDSWGIGQGVLRSEDGGRTWAWSNEGMEGKGVTDLTFGPAASGLLYAATSGGLYQSRDRGVSWSLLAFRGQSVRHVAVAPSDPKVVLASGWNGKALWTRRSTDRGRTFVRVLQKSVETYAFDPSRPRRVIGISLAGDNRYALVRSDDLGAHWKVLAPLSSPWRTLGITPAGALLAGSELGGLLRSGNGGATWSLLLAGRDGLPLDVVSSLVMLDNAILAGGERGVWRSGKAGWSWSLSNQGIQGASSLVKVAADDDSTIWVGTGTGLFLSRNRGATFQLHAEGMGPRGRVMALAVHPEDPETAYAIGCCVDPWGLTVPGMLKTEDGGRSWRALKYPGFRYGPLTLEVDPVESDVVYGGGYDDDRRHPCTAWRSMDGGAAWSCIAPEDLDLVDLAIDPHDRRILYGLFNGEPYRSEDRGTSWTKLAEGDDLMFSIAVDPFQADRLYAGGNGVYRSDDGGRTWSTRLSPVPGGSSAGFLIDPRHPGWLWGFRDGRILHSEDAGDSWADVGSLLSPDGVRISSLTLDPRSPDVFYGTASGMVYRLRLP